MKRVKRTLVPFLVVALALTLSTPVFAEGTGIDTDPFVGTGGLGDSTYNGTITIHKYDIAAWEKKTNEDSSIGRDANYTITYFGLDAVGKAIATGGQVGYYYLNQTDEDNDANRQPVALSELAAVSNIVFRLTSATPQAGKEGSSDPDDYDIAASPAIDSYGKTSSGEFKWTGVPKGYYILEEIPNATVEVPAQKIVVSMPMFDPDTTQADNEELKDIHIYPKNEVKSDPNVEKEITANFENGNVISWKITAEIPADIATGKKYTISDTFSKGLTLLPSTIVVTKSATPGGTGTTVPAADYTLVGPTPNPEGTTTFAIDFDDTQRPKLDGSVELVITYDTVVNLTEEEWNDAVNPSNEVQLVFTNEDDNTFDPSLPPVVVEELALLEITKVDGVTGTLLDDAEFQIYTKLDAGEVDPDSGLRDAAGNPVTLKTEDGKTLFYGLPEGTYYLVETKAPNQYKVLTGYFTFTISAEQAAGRETVKVGPINNYLDSGFTLPQTGGPGTLWFTIIGVSLVLAGGLAYLVYKKRKNNAA